MGRSHAHARRAAAMQASAWRSKRGETSVTTVAAGRGVMSHVQQEPCQRVRSTSGPRRAREGPRRMCARGRGARRARPWARGEAKRTRARSAAHVEARGPAQPPDPTRPPPARPPLHCAGRARTPRLGWGRGSTGSHGTDEGRSRRSRSGLGSLSRTGGSRGAGACRWSRSRSCAISPSRPGRRRVRSPPAPRPNQPGDGCAAGDWRERRVPPRDRRPPWPRAPS